MWSIRRPLLASAMLMAGLVASACGRDETPAAADREKEGGSWLAEAMRDPVFRQACEELEYCAEPLYPAPGPREKIWRVRVVREASGAVRIADVDVAQVPAGEGVPVGPLGGDYLLVGLDGDGDPVDGQLLRFPESLRIELTGVGALQRQVELEGRTVDAIAYLRALPSIETLAVRDESGAVVASAAVPATLSSAAARAPDVPWGFAAPALAQSSSPPPLPPFCSHVIVLQGEADRALADNLAWDVLPQVVKELAAEHAGDAVRDLADMEVSDFQPTLVIPGKRQLAVLRAALGRMTPLLCQSVGRIAFASFPAMRRYASGAVFQAGGGDIMMVNVDSGYDEESLKASAAIRIRLQKTILHEAGHCAEALLNAQGGSPGVYAGEWKPPARALASETIERVRLRGGFGVEWRRVHDSFLELGWAAPYEESSLVTGATWQLSPVEVTNRGFMSNYGANIWWDDIAEFVAQPYIAGELASAGEARHDHGCLQMQAHGERNVPARLAAVYTKLLFVRDLGLVPPKQVDDCIGTHLGLQATAPGFEIWSGDNRVRAFSDRVSAGIGTETLGNRVFEMMAAGEAGFMGETYPATVKLRLDLGRRLDELEEVPWPRGAYELGLFGDNNFELRLDGAAAGNFDARDGYVLVVEASNQRIAGSVFLTKVMRLHAPLPVPEVYDPPLVFRFLLQK